MRTAYCPKTHTELANICVSHGHIPGHQYHDVAVVISSRGDKFRCHVVESWGNDQGYDQENGRKEIIGRGDSIREAVVEARNFGTEANIDSNYLAQALSLAEDAAEEAMADAE